ncbi:MAG: hypothetical protein IKT00_06230, partial [Prevotella sp.]|nr:hypothetical protein [Prevotella sp.]
PIVRLGLFVFMGFHQGYLLRQNVYSNCVDCKHSVDESRCAQQISSHPEAPKPREISAFSFLVGFHLEIVIVITVITVTIC